MSSTTRIHRTAILSPDVVLGNDVVIGPQAVLDGPVRLGDGCVVRPGAYLFGPLTMGPRNTVYTGAILGEAPQHLKYKGEPTTLEIGEGNLFRENVTIHRGTTHSGKTVIGNFNFFMAGSHVGHDCVIGNRCILTNGSMIGGHCVLEDNVILAGNAAVHQFVRIGRLAMLGGLSGSTKDIPPFIIQQNIDTTSGINVIGMRRAGLSNFQINAVRDAFKILYREGRPLPAAVAKIQSSPLGEVDVVQEMLQFLSGCHKGVSPMRSRFREEAA